MNFDFGALGFSMAHCSLKMSRESAIAVKRGSKMNHNNIQQHVVSFGVELVQERPETMIIQ